MGIFNNRPQTDQPYQDAGTPDPAAATQPVSIDGTLPGQDQPAVDHANPLSSQSAPVMDEPADNDAGDYIVTAPPVVASTEPQDQPDQPAYIEDTPPAASDPLPAAAEPPVTDQSDSSNSQTEDQPESEASPITVRTSPNQNDQGGELTDLANIKQDALKQLAPLVPHLDQTPEEKFHTAMMMLQATDDPSLVKAAYDAAQAITDEKARAQALLDIVNEINYFTQQNKNS